MPVPIRSLSLPENMGTQTMQIYKGLFTVQNIPSLQIYYKY